MTSAPAHDHAAETVAVLGATGRTGRQLVEYALADGLAVRALARDPRALRDLGHPRLTVVAGDATDADAIARVIEGAACVFSALGGGTTAEPGTTRSTAVSHVVEASHADGIPDRRLIVMAGGGILDSPAGGLRQEQPSFPAIFRAVSAEHRRAWEVVRESELAWTMVCTGDIVPGERTGVYRALPDVMPVEGRRISIQELAGFMLDEFRAGQFVRRRVGLAY